MSVVWSQNDPAHSGPCPGCRGYFAGDYPMEHRDSQCAYRYVDGKWVKAEET